MRRFLVVLFAAGAFAVTACGDDGDAEKPGFVDPPGANAGVLGGVRYRVLRFRRLDLRESPDRLFVDGEPAGRGVGVYGAFLHACNVADKTTRTAGGLRLLTAGNGRFAPISSKSDNLFAYRPIELAAGQCLPRNGTPAEPVSSRVVAFRVPLERIDDIPLRLELHDGGDRLRLRVKT